MLIPHFGIDEERNEAEKKLPKRCLAIDVAAGSYSILHIALCALCNACAVQGNCTCSGVTNENILIGFHFPLNFWSFVFVSF